MGFAIAPILGRRIERILAFRRQQLLNLKVQRDASIETTSPSENPHRS
jgi:hypothetical protein